MSLTDKLKILMGRKLSAEQMERAKAGIQIDGLLSDEKCDQSIDYTSVKDGQFVREIRKYEFTTTRDISHREMLHTGHYETYREVRTYNSNGDLVEKNIVHIKPPFRFGSSKTINYEPAGSFFGKEVVKEEKK